MKKLILFLGVLINFAYGVFADLSAEESKVACEIVKNCRERIFLDRIKHDTIRKFADLIKRNGLTEKMDVLFHYKGRETTLRQESKLIAECIFFCGKKEYEKYHISNFRDLMMNAVPHKALGPLRVALEEGADPNEKVEVPILQPGPLPIFEKSCGLHPVWLIEFALSITEGDLQIMTLLLEHKANPNITCFEGYTLLTTAIARGYFDLVPLLLSRGANPNIVRNDVPALLEAISIDAPVEIIINLLDHNADPNRVGMNGAFPLHLAVYKGNKPVVNALLEHEANLEARTKGGLTPFLFAVVNKNLDMATFLLEKGANIFALDSCGFNCYEIANNLEISGSLRKIMVSKLLELSHVFDPKRCDSTSESKALAIEKLKKMFPNERETVIKLLLLPLKTLSVFPCEFISDDVIYAWLQGKFGHFIDSMRPNDLENIIDELGNEFSEFFMPEEHREKVTSFIHKIIEMRKHRDDAVQPVSKEDYPITSPTTPTRTQKEKQKKARREAKRAMNAQDTTTSKEEKPVKKPQQEPWDMIFDLNPGSKNEYLDDGKEGLEVIKCLLEFLKSFGIRFVMEKSDHYYFKVESIEPAWANDFYKNKGFIRSIADTHNGHKVYARHYEETISYFFHYVFLLARNVPEAREGCHDLLIKYQDNLGKYRENIKETYRDELKLLGIIL